MKKNKKDKAAGGASLFRAAELLAAAPLFTGFTRAELEFLAEKSEFIEYADGARVFEPGASSDRLYLAAAGSVVVFSGSDDSVLAEFVSGDSFGELEFLTGAKHNAGARAAGNTTLLCFPSGGMSLRDALSGRPELAARILRSFLLVVSGRTRKANALVKENSPWVRELKRQVYGDKLTGLFNRAYLEENLPKLLGAAPALLMLKPDNFKEINDRFGHEIGDAALVFMAREAERAVAPDGTVARYDGNELAVLYPRTERAAALEKARSLQARLSSLDLSPVTGDPGLRLRVSIGIAVYPDHGETAESLIKACAGLPLIARSRGGSLILFPEDAA